MRNLIVCLLVSAIFASGEKTQTKDKQKRGLLLANVGENHDGSYSSGLNPGYSSIIGVTGAHAGGLNNGISIDSRVLATSIPGRFSSHGSSLTGSTGTGIASGFIPGGSPAQATGIAITRQVPRPIYIQQPHPVDLRQRVPIVENTVPVTIPVSRPILIAVRVPHVVPIPIPAAHDTGVRNLGTPGSIGSGPSNAGHSGGGLSGYASSYSGYQPTGGHGSGISSNGPAGGSVSYTLVSTSSAGEGSGFGRAAGLGPGLTISLAQGANLRSGLGSGLNVGHGSSFGANIGLESGIQGSGVSLGAGHGAHSLSTPYSYSRPLEN